MASGPNPASFPVFHGCPATDAGAHHNQEISMSMFNNVTKSFQWGRHNVVLETG